MVRVQAGVGLIMTVTFNRHWAGSGVKAVHLLHVFVSDLHLGEFLPRTARVRVRVKVSIRVRYVRVSRTEVSGNRTWERSDSSFGF